MEDFEGIINDFSSNLTKENDSYAGAITQRSDEWFEQRKGRFTASTIKNLMSVERSESRMEWGRPEKMISFSKTAIKLIYSKFKERQRNKVIKSASSAAMRYGTDNEYIIFNLLQEQLPEYSFVNMPFVHLKGHEEKSGASPDGKAVATDNEVLNVEIKACTSWDTFFERIQKHDQSSIDFWQIQHQMMCTETKKTIYCVAEPSTDIFEPDITDINIQIVEASPIHQNAILQRIILADKVIELMLKGDDIYTALSVVCGEYEF